jgi:hypothetical protein
MTTPYSATLSHPACIGSSGWQLQAAHPPLGGLAQLRCCCHNPLLQQRHLGDMACRDWPSSTAYSRTAQSPLAPGRVRRLRFRRLHMRAPQPLSAYLPHHGSMQPGKIPAQPYLYSRCRKVETQPRRSRCTWWCLAGPGFCSCYCPLGHVELGRNPFPHSRDSMPTRRSVASCGEDYS